MSEPSMHFCHSCAMPLNDAQMQRNKSDYCIYCTDENGNLKDWSDILAGSTEIIAAWQQISLEEAKKRAIRYLSAMPAWADKITPQ